MGIFQITDMSILEEITEYQNPFLNVPWVVNEKKGLFPTREGTCI